MKKKLIALFFGASTLALGGVTLIEKDAKPATITNIPEKVETLTNQFNFGDVPPHTSTVDSNGLITIDVGEKKYTIEPLKLETDKAEGTKDKSTALKVESIGEDVYIKDAWSATTDIKLTNTKNTFSKVVSFSQDDFKALAADTKFIEVKFEITGFEIPDGIYSNRIEIQPNVWLEKGKAWDSSPGDEANDIPNQNYTDVEFEVIGNTLIKRIPVEWFKTATFPVYTDAVFTFGTAQTVSTANIGYGTIAKIGDSKFVTCWSDATDATVEGYCVVATTSTTSITYGSSTQNHADNWSFSSVSGPTVCPIGTDKFALLYVPDTTFIESLVVATTTGLVINGYSPPITLLNTDYVLYMECEEISTDRIVVSFLMDSVDDNAVMICNISGSTATCGTITTIVNGSGTNNTFRNNDCGKLNDDQFVCRTNYVTGSQVLVYAGSVSGTSTISIGNVATVTNSSPTESGVNGRLLTFGTSNFVVLSQATSTFNTSITVGSVTGTVVTLGASTTIIATSSQLVSMLKIDDDSFAIFGQIGNADALNTYLGIIYCDVDTSLLTVSCQSPEVYSASTDIGSFVSGVALSSTKFVLGWEDDNSSNDLFEIIGDLIVSASTYLQDILWFD